MRNRSVFSPATRRWHWPRKRAWIWSRSSRTATRRSAASWIIGKFKFEAQKKAQAAKKKQKQVEIKEVKFRPITDVGDYQIKLRNMLRFLEEGDKVKVTIRFRGREMSHQDLGQNLAKKIQEDVGENGVVESFPRLEGRQMVMMIGPKKKQ